MPQTFHLYNIFIAYKKIWINGLHKKNINIDNNDINLNKKKKYIYIYIYY